MATKKPEMRAELLEITPYLATKWLELNNDNRNMSDRWVDSIAMDIKAGKWDPNNASIGIHVDTKGEPKRVVDGQHRLWAIVKSGQSIWSWVVFGDERNLKRENIDRVKPRSVSDQLKLLDGVERASFVSATLNVLNGFDGPFTHAVGVRPLTVERARALLVIHQRGFTWYKVVIQDASGPVSRKVIDKSSVAAAFIYAYPTSMARVDAFAKQVRDGENLVKDDPAYALRAYLLRSTTAVGSRDSRQQRFEIMVVCMRGIMAHLRNEKLTTLKGNMLASGEFAEKARNYFAKAQQTHLEAVPPVVRKAAGR